MERQKQHLFGHNSYQAKENCPYLYKFTLSCPFAPLFADLNTLTVQDINKLQTALFMYKYHNNLLPDIFTDYFVKANTIHGYNTRQSYMYRPCYFNTHLANNSIKRQGPLIWSSVPQNIRDSTSVFSFKTKFKAEFISRY